MNFTNQKSKESSNVPATTTTSIARPDKPKIKYHKSKTPTYNVPPASYPHSATFRPLGGKKSRRIRNSRRKYRGNKKSKKRTRRRRRK